MKASTFRRGIGYRKPGYCKKTLGKTSRSSSGAVSEGQQLLVMMQIRVIHRRFGHQMRPVQVVTMIHDEQQQARGETSCQCLKVRTSFKIRNMYMISNVFRRYWACQVPRFPSVLSRHAFCHNLITHRHASLLFSSRSECLQFLSCNSNSGSLAIVIETDGERILMQVIHRSFAAVSYVSFCSSR